MATVTVAECESCGRKYGERHQATMRAPDVEEIAEMMDDATATDGCAVEPDGICPHGHQSWLLRLGMI